jgi:hypothetical protein
VRDHRRQRAVDQNVPGRKTDVKDAEWIADLLCHGLLRSSFVPPEPIRELRDLLRYRRNLVESRSGERNRLLKLLETVDIRSEQRTTGLESGRQWKPVFSRKLYANLSRSELTVA